jgi:polyisoprenoid-binding protein YceI
MKRLTMLVAAGTMLAACGPSEPPAPPPLDPTGTYSITIDAEGMQIGGSLVIRGTTEAYTGSIDTDMGGAALADIAVDGNQVSFTVPEAGVSFQVTFEGEGFNGTFDGAMGTGYITGRKRAGS